MTDLVNTINGIVWSPVLVAMCLCIGLYFSLKLKFFQIRDVKEMFTLLLEGDSSNVGISSFQGFATSMAGRIGTGNIAGVAVAIAMGGPGALVWMCIMATLGSATAFVESTLAQIYKDEHDGQYRGGPPYYFEKGLGWKKCSVLFSIVAIISYTFFMPGTQSNTLYLAMNQAFGFSKMTIAVASSIALAIIIFGGIKRIGLFAEKVVPIMGGAYLIMTLVIIITNISLVPEAIVTMFKSAFGFGSVFGGMLGSAISWGVKRGIYSNEAGEGSGTYGAAAAEVSHPAKQGLVQAFSVYVDTLLICMATGIMIVITGMYNVTGVCTTLPGVEPGPQYVQSAINTLHPQLGDIFIAIVLLLFTFTTLLAFSYMMETNVSYLVTRIKAEKHEKYIINVCRFMLITCAAMCCFIEPLTSWALGDICIGVLTYINLIAIFTLKKPAIKAYYDYIRQKKMGIKRSDRTFNPIELDIRNAEFWENRYLKEDKHELN
ncbi:alanine/glycine:cation symporter family protein [Clostridioides difficile]|uniref:alanine/glycine:cation symporter family protein n=1 Tax=Clostridioides difficile TaxID=1496 RepID=UPI00097FFF9F|nr:alanine/glycine:cation symporter family protein [Clostridioides difficile]SJS76968.1 Na+/alanine symporter [Clostridioides difficile]SJS81992.1 Na+/alanine symporter [Clostridioides difficile]SJT16013.1 Na+/alanine symporter [Clostridioides difficile]HBF5147160.1 alanine:cation symporter family protein [Clostridioides difficile]